MEWLTLRPLTEATGDELGVSRPGGREFAMR
jgi:hypothetical protein